MQYLLVYRLSTGEVFYTQKCDDLVQCAKDIDRMRNALSPRTIVDTYKLVESVVLD